MLQSAIGRIYEKKYYTIYIYTYDIKNWLKNAQDSIDFYENNKDRIVLNVTGLTSMAAAYCDIGDFTNAQNMPTKAILYKVMYNLRQ